MQFIRCVCVCVSTDIMKLSEELPSLHRAPVPVRLSVPAGPMPGIVRKGNDVKCVMVTCFSSSLLSLM